MSAPHFFAVSVEGDRIRIEGEEARHAVRVLRIRTGERITVSDGAGTVAEAVVVEASSALVAEVTGRRTIPPSLPRVTVFQGIAKAGKLDVVVQKLTEIGVDEIVPLQAGRSVARWEGRGARIERLRIVAREAAKQSRRAWLPVVGEPVTAGQARSEGLALVLHETADSRLSGALPGAPPERIALFVGPEGGFDEGEVSGLVARGARAVGLGPQILRTETAALVAATIVLGRYGRIG